MGQRSNRRRKTTTKRRKEKPDKNWEKIKAFHPDSPVTSHASIPSHCGRDSIPHACGRQIGSPHLDARSIEFDILQDTKEKRGTEPGPVLTA
jgi:hypothetical protein